MESRVLILGQDRLTVALVPELKWLGCGATVAQGSGVASAFPLADRVYSIDLQDKSAISRIVLGENPATVVVCGSPTRPWLFSLGAEFAALGMRVFPSPEACSLACSTGKLGQFLDKAGIPKNIGFFAETFDEVVTAADVLGYPCSLRASNIHTVVRSRGELGHCWETFYANGSLEPGDRMRVQGLNGIAGIVETIAGFDGKREFISDPVGFWTEVDESTYPISKEQSQFVRDISVEFLRHAGFEGVFTFRFSISSSDEVAFYDFNPHPRPNTWVRMKDANEDSLSLYSQIISGLKPKSISIPGESSEEESPQYIVL